MYEIKILRIKMNKLIDAMALVFLGCINIRLAIKIRPRMGSFYLSNVLDRTNIKIINLFINFPSICQMHIYVSIKTFEVIVKGIACRE